MWRPDNVCWCEFPMGARRRTIGPRRRPIFTIRLPEQHGLFGASTILIEDKASGTQLVQDLIEEGLSAVRAVKPDGDKIMRLHAQTATIENGFVHLPTSAPWLADSVRQTECGEDAGPLKRTGWARHCQHVALQGVPRLAKAHRLHFLSATRSCRKRRSTCKAQWRLETACPSTNGTRRPCG
jgi:hypothetical protein